MEGSKGLLPAFPIGSNMDPDSSFDQQRSTMFIVDSTQPSRSHVEVCLVTRHMIDVFHLATNLDS